jgi:hypothetical protein
MGKSDSLADPVKLRSLISTGCSPDQHRHGPPVFIVVWLPLRGWDRITARAVLSGESPKHAPFRNVQRVPHSTMTHVSASPPFHPGRSDFPSPVGDLDTQVLFPKGPSQLHRNLSANSHTPLM